VSTSRHRLKCRLDAFKFLGHIECLLCRLLQLISPGVCQFVSLSLLWLHSAAEQNRNNLWMTLAASSCGASAETIQIFALALCYSVAEYCLFTVFPHWAGSCTLTLELHRVTDLRCSTFHSSSMVTSPC